VLQLNGAGQERLTLYGSIYLMKMTLLAIPFALLIIIAKNVVTADLKFRLGHFFSGDTPAIHAGYWGGEEVGKIITGETCHRLAKNK
jgi:hypothetical protein